MATAIMIGLKERKKSDKQHKKERNAPVSNVSTEEEDVITHENAISAAITFLRKLGIRVNDSVSLEIFNREGMKRCLKEDVFGGLPYEVARLVDNYGQNGRYAICKKLLGQHAHAATRSTGIVYDENNQESIIKLSDHSGLTIGEVLGTAIGDKR